jgi:hypothetical protein
MAQLRQGSDPIGNGWNRPVAFFIAAREILESFLHN